MELKEQLSYNLLFVGMSILFITAVIAFIRVILAKFMTPELLGIYSSASYLAYFLAFLSTLGFPGALGKLVPESKRQNERRTYLTTSLFFTMLISTLLILTLLSISEVIVEWMKLTSDIYFLVILFFPVLAVYNIFYSYNYGLQRMRRIFFVNVFRLTSILLSILFVAFLFKMLPEYVIIIFLLFTLISTLFLVDKLGRVGNFKKLFTYSSVAFTSSLIDNSVFLLPMIFLPVFTDQYITGLFALAFFLSRFVFIFPVIMTQAVFPLFSHYQNNIKKLQYLFKIFLKYTFLITLPIIPVFFFFKSTIIFLFATEDYLRASEILFQAIVGVLLLILFSNITTLFYATAKIRKFLKLKLTSIIFIPIFLFMLNNYGLITAVYSYFIYLPLLFIAVFEALKSFKVKINFKKVFYFMLTLSLYILLLNIIDTYVKIQILKLFLSAASFITYLALSFILGLIKKDEISFFYRMVRKHAKI